MRDLNQNFAPNAVRRSQSIDFSPGGLLNKFKDSHGNEINYVYDAAGRLASLGPPLRHRFLSLRRRWPAAGKMVTQRRHRPLHLERRFYPSQLHHTISTTHTPIAASRSRHHPPLTYDYDSRNPHHPDEQSV